jgi:predicted dithiol-disulfide oxidoreductase (DUF899 family)
MEDDMVSFPNESREYRAARDRLLQQEIELRRQMEAVAEERRKLPEGGLMREDYTFDCIGPDGKAKTVKFSELFAPGKDSLIVYNMMFPRYKTDTRQKPESGALSKLPIEETPCPSCTTLLDQLNPAVWPLEAAGFNFAVIGKAPIDRLDALAKDRGWKNLRMLSSAKNRFNRDYHTEDEEGQQTPLTSVFRRSSEGIRHFWSSELSFAKSDPGQDPRADGTLEPLWNLMDLTPGGRPDFLEQMQYEGEPAARCH